MVTPWFARHRTRTVMGNRHWCCGGAVIVRRVGALSRLPAHEHVEICIVIAQCTVGARFAPRHVTHGLCGIRRRMSRMRPTVDDCAVAASGDTRETRIRAASAAISLIAEEIGMRAAVVLLWCCFEECLVRLEQEKTSRD
jgi:hypothetical protein